MPHYEVVTGIYLFLQKKINASAGYRTQYLQLTKQMLYHLSYRG